MDLFGGGDQLKILPTNSSFLTVDFRHFFVCFGPLVTQLWPIRGPDCAKKMIHQETPGPHFMKESRLHNLGHLLFLFAGFWSDDLALARRTPGHETR